MARASLPRQIRFKIAPGAKTLTAQINVDALRIAFRNRIDNALLDSAPDAVVE